MKVYKPYLIHILQEIDYLVDSSAGMTLQGFCEDETRKRAFIRSLEIMGEAVKNIPDSIKQQYPEIPWRKIAAMRDKLIHFYFGVDYILVWSVVQNELPKLREEIKLILSEIDFDEKR